MECADCGRVYTWEELNSLGVTHKKPAQEPRNYKPTECEKWVAGIRRQHDALCREITQLEDLLKELPGKIERLRADEKEASQKLDDEMCLWGLALARDGMSISRIKEEIGKPVSVSTIDSIWFRQFRSHWELYRQRNAPTRSILSDLRNSPPLYP